MTVAELRAHLDDRLEVLTRRRGVNARHQSLRATVAWSYDLLTGVEQSFFDELSVFGADFSADAARAVGGDAPGAGCRISCRRWSTSRCSPPTGAARHTLPTARDSAPIR